MNQPQYVPMMTKEESMENFISLIRELFAEDCALMVIAYHPSNDDVSIRANLPPAGQRSLIAEALSILPEIQ